MMVGGGSFSPWVSLCVQLSPKVENQESYTHTQNLLCSLARWLLIRLHESPRYLVSNGRKQEAVVALRAIATFNDHTMDIREQDVAMDESHTHHAHEDEEVRLVRTPRPKDKKDSESVTPATPAEASPIRHARSRSREVADESGSSSRANYDALGRVTPPMPHRLIRQGSAFYDSPYDEAHRGGGNANTFDASFAKARVGEEGEGEGEENEEDEDEDEEEMKHFGTESHRRKPRGMAGHMKSWAGKWAEQMAKLFSPHWRVTVILMWLIWGCMSFGKSLSSRLVSLLDDRSCQHTPCSTSGFRPCWRAERARGTERSERL